MMKYLFWGIKWPFVFIVGLIGILLSPISALCVKKEMYTTTVKRLGKAVTTLERYRLRPWAVWFDTDDNATDEYWYGMYGFTAELTQDQYDSSAWLRYRCRVMWLQRNSMYTFTRKFFGLAKDSTWAWQYQAVVPTWFGFNNDINIGYKAHKGIDRLTYAGRIFKPV